MEWKGGHRGRVPERHRPHGQGTLGAFRSTPLGIVTAESDLTPARALLNRHQASFAQRINARPKDGEGPEEILTRERSALATRLYASAALRRTETVEPQVWSTGRRFPGGIVIEGREAAIITTSHSGQGDTIWTDG